MKTPTIETAKKLINLLSFGLTKGLGQPEPGYMCIEALKCFVLDLPHSDNPPCVSNAVRSFSIALNDLNWSSNIARADGLKRLGIAQLGSNTIDETIFVKELALATIKKILPIALRNAKLEQEAIACEKVATLQEGITAAESAAESAKSAAESAKWSAKWAAKSAAESAAESVKWSAESAKSTAEWAAWAAEGAAWAAESAKSAKSAEFDNVLSLMAECAVQALVVCKSPGCEWLHLAS